MLLVCNSVASASIQYRRSARPLCLRRLAGIRGEARAGVRLRAHQGEAKGDRGAEPGASEGEASTGQTTTSATAAAGGERPFDAGLIWALMVMSVSYVHHSVTGFGLPALLPAISTDLQLSDSQAALLTVGYTLLYALALVPAGLVADKVDRPQLLSVGVAAWSLLTVLSSKATSFQELLLCRVGFAVAQATQNPVCFSMIPEMFTSNRSTFMAVYNAAIYLGRSLSFGSVILAASLAAPDGGSTGLKMVPLDQMDLLDLTQMGVLYTTGDMVAAVPLYDYNITFQLDKVDIDAWRQVLMWVGVPGLVIAALVLLTVAEPRTQKAFTGDPFASSRFLSPGVRSLSASAAASRRPTVASRPVGGRPPASRPGSAAPLGRTTAPPPPPGGNGAPPQPRGGPAAATPAAAAAAAVSAEAAPSRGPSTGSVLKQLLSKRAFYAVTFASALNDVGSWAMVSWHATFYERVYSLPAEVYAPALAVIIPLGGLVGGVGGGLAADRLSGMGARQWLTGGAMVLSAPFIAASFLAPTHQQSFGALLLGFALSEAWRSSSAVIVRDVAPEGSGSAASAIHLCLRNLLGCVGPLGVAWLAERTDLQQAMLMVPACFALSGLAFFATEAMLQSDSR